MAAAAPSPPPPLVLDTCDAALRYAHAHVPQLQPLTAQQLSGGYCNYVFRIRCRNPAVFPSDTDDDKPLGTSPLAPEDKQQSLCSVIVKSYPPYSATTPSLAISTGRCMVELTALRLQAAAAAAAELGSLEPPASLCRIPRVLHGDPAAGVIIMEDAGERLVSLLAALTRSHALPAPPQGSSSPGQPGAPPPQQPQHPDHSQLLPGEWPGMTAAVLAQALQGFLAALAAQGAAPAFENPAAWAVLGAFYGGAAAAAARFDSPPLCSWISRAAPVLPPARAVTSLILGDLWPNTVHFDPGARTVWLLDWELARRGSHRADAEQLLDNLWLMRQNPGSFRSETLQLLTRQLQLRFCGGEDRDWRAGREPEFVRSVAMLSAFPHWGLAQALPQVMQQAVQEAEELQGHRAV